jgi:hypothetical protein
LAIVLPLQAMTIKPPGTSSRILLVDGLVLGDTVADGDDDGETDGDTDAPPDAVGDELGDGIGVDVGVTAPPTALPSRQTNTYSIPIGVLVAVGDGECGGVVVGAGAGGGVVGFGNADLVVTTGATVGRMLAAVLSVDTAGLGVGGCDDGVTTAIDVEAAAIGCGSPCALSRFELSLTSRPTRSTAVSVTAVISTHDNTQPRASVSGRPARPRRRSPRGSWGGCCDDTPSFSAQACGPGVKPLSSPRPRCVRRRCQEHLD